MRSESVSREKKKKNPCILLKVTLGTYLTKTRPSKEAHTGSTPNIGLIPTAVHYKGV